MKASPKTFLAVVAVLLLLTDLSFRLSEFYFPDAVEINNKLFEKINASVLGSSSVAAQRERWLKQGISKVYIDLFEEAERSIPEVPGRRHLSRGVLFVTFGGINYAKLALRAAKRTQRSLSLEGDHDVKIAYFCEQKVIDKLRNTCDSSKPGKRQGTHSAASISSLCDDWKNGTVFTGGVFALERFPIHPNASAFKTRQATVTLWMSKTQALLHSPFERTLFLDTDAFTCPGFSRIFDLVNPFTKKLWMAPSTKSGDLVIGLDQYPYNNNHRYWPSPGDLKRLNDFKYFADRNTGTQLYNFKKGSYAMLFLNFHRLVEEYLYAVTVNATKTIITNDQVTFKLALYLFQKFQPGFTEHTIPQHTSCRSYPGKDFAGIDGMLTGMIPSGCTSCSCSPCLISHFASTYFLKED